MSTVFNCIQNVIIFFISWPILLSLSVILSANVYEKDLQSHLCRVEENAKNSGKKKIFVTLYVTAMGRQSRWLVAGISIALLIIFFLYARLYEGN